MASEPPRKRKKPSHDTATGSHAHSPHGDGGFDQLDEDAATGPSTNVDGDVAGEVDDARDYRDQSFYEPVKFGEFGKYMHNKRLKLKVQNAALLEEGAEKPQIFKNLRIYVNGFTESITLPELTELLVRHGGDYVPYLDKKSLVTHIIATNLTPTKRKEFAKYKVATPDWLVKSAEQGRLLDWRQFSLLAPPKHDVPRLNVAQGTLEAEDAARLGTQSGQRSLFSMGVGARGAAPVRADTAAGPSASSSAAASATSAAMGTSATSRNVETHESLAERGARLAREALKAQANGPLHSFFDRTTTTLAPARQISPRKVVPTPREQPSPKLPATTDSPTKPTSLTRSWLPSTERNERTAALLKDEDWLAKHTSASPDFLAGYFAQSRLHWISSFKEELKDIIAAKQHGKTPPRRTKKLTGGASDGRTIVHVDFDCFFVSAGLTTRQELRGKPVAVCHARGKGEAASSTSEIASCSYEARASGVRNGMSLGRARELCPDIQTMPFEFDLYRSITLRFYDILLSHAAYIQVVSMDECLAELVVPPTVFREQDPAYDLAKRIKQEIFDATGCPASIGISYNILLARLAMRKAKPASIFHLFPEDVDDFLLPLEVDALPGIGWSLRSKLLNELGIKTVHDLRRASPAKLADTIGRGNSKKFTAFAFGVDDAELESQKLRQSVSTEVNYGIRFGPGRIDQVERFVRELGDETAKRLRTAGLKARQLVLHVMIRHPEAPIDTPKFLGHGHVNQENRTAILSGPNGGATDDGGLVGETAWRLMASLKALPHELRGIGIQLTKLEKEGFSVETVHEKGQSRLSFRPREAASVDKQSTDRVSRDALATDSEQSHAVGVGRSSDQSRRASTRLAPADALVLTSDSSADEAAVEPTREPVAEEKGGRLRSRSARLSVRPAEPYIPSMFRPTKKSAKVASKSASQVTADELRYYDIDPEAYETFDRALQAEILAEARRLKPPPAKGKSKGRAKGKGLRASRSTKSAESEQPLPSPPEVIVLPPSPAEATDSQIIAMQYDPEIFRQLGKATQLEQVALHHARQARTVPGERTLRDQGKAEAPSGKVSNRSRPPMRAVTVRPAPRFQGQTNLVEILNRLEAWMETAAEHAPDREDIDTLGRYIERCASRQRGHDLAQATEIVRWWDCLLRQAFASASPALADVAELWQLGYRQVCERLERVVQTATGRRLKM
ncbi:hypothetical protein JCM10908_000100 [Rhodotorula pacifica]|uniref:deoxycytidyl transferase n=1 Tax=Rhodotorula pacifica TaxID=1495444 RepID=UPI00317EE17A